MTLADTALRWQSHVHYKLGIAMLSLVIFLFLVFALLSYYWLDRLKSSYRLYMILGAIISTISCSCVTGLYITQRKLRRHPNNLLFWKSSADLVFALRFLFPLDVFISPSNCNLLAVVSQFFAFSSECWFVLISIDLWFSVTNPFFDTQFYECLYHGFAWGMGLFTSLALYLSHPDFNTLTSGDSCWFSDASKSIAWILYYGPVILFVLLAGVILLFEQQRMSQISGGMKETLKAREKLISSTRIVTITYSLYQSLVILFWIADVYFTTEKESQLSIFVNNFSALFHGAKGLIDLISWIAINHPHMLLGGFGGPATGDRKASSEVDGDEYEYQPQLNIELRKEVLHFTTRGIIASVIHCSQRENETPEVLEPHPQAMAQKKRTMKLVKLRIHDLGMSIRFNDYEPLTFQSIRRGFGIDDDTYNTSFSRTCHERIQSGGASGAFMFFTADYYFIVKSVTKPERATLLKMLMPYKQHMQRHANSHLTRFYGCHSIHMYGKSFSFVVMGNVIGKCSMHQFYDIKGSWVDRNAEVVHPGKTMICTYCSQSFQTGSRDTCEYSVRGIHMPHVVLKDNDFRKKLRLSRDTAKALVSHIRTDVDFLQSRGIMDYSLLLSVHSAKFPVDPTSHPLEEFQPTKRRVNIIMPSKTMTTETMSAEQSHQQQRKYRFSIVQSQELPNSPCSSPEVPIELSPFLPKGDSGPVSGYGSCIEKPGPSPMNEIPGKDGWEGERQMILDGYRAEAVIGADYYTLGIIDVLQTWTLKKQCERFWKVYIRCLDGRGISATPPRAYAERFLDKIQDLVFVSTEQPDILYQH